MQSTQKEQKMDSIKWICILGPSVKKTREFIKSLDLHPTADIQYFLSNESYFFGCENDLRTTHMLELVNHFNKLSKRTVKPKLIVSDYSFDYYLTQILEQSVITTQTIKTWEEFCLNMQESLELSNVTKYIFLNEIFTKRDDYTGEEYLKYSANIYLQSKGEENVEVVDNSLYGISVVKSEIYSLL